MKFGSGGAGIYYGWFIVAVAFIANFLGSGTAFYIFNAFIEPLCETRGWTRAQINIAPMLGYVVNLFGVLFYGTMVARVGPRVLMIGGSVIAAVSFFLLGMATGLPVFYVLFMLLFFGVSGMSGIVTATAVGNWFVLRRGNALGLATAGVSVAGVILPAAAHAIIQTSGLFYAFLWIGVAIIAVAPLSFAVIRTRPEDYGLLPDGAVHEPGIVYDENPFHNQEQSYSQHNVAAHWTFPMVVRNRSFWKIGIAYGLSMTSVLGVMFQLKPRFGDVGFDGDTAMKLMAATALAGAAGKYAWAYLCDKFSSRGVVTVLLLQNAVGLGLGIIHGSLAAVILFIVTYGFAMGGVVSTQPVIIADFYGRDAYPTVARYIGMVVGIDCIGYPIMGMSFDLTGSYDSAYLVFIALDVIAAVVIGSLKRTERQ